MGLRGRVGRRHHRLKRTDAAPQQRGVFVCAVRRPYPSTNHRGRVNAACALFLIGKVVLVNPLELNRASDANADVVLYHQVG